MSRQSSFRSSPIVGYIRSPRLEDEQVDEMESQIREYAKNHGFYLETVLREMRRSAVATWRPVLEQLIRELKHGRFVGVVLPSLDHLGRPRSLALRNLERLRDTSAWVTFLDSQGVPMSEEER